MDSLPGIKSLFISQDERYVIISKHLTKYASLILLSIEPLILTGMILAFWHHSPPIRDNWVGLLWLAVPVFRLRYMAYQRLWTYTLLIDAFLLFIVLSAYNYHHAPLHRLHYGVLMCRPLMGIWLYIYLSDHSRQFDMKLPLVGAVGIAFVAGVVALTATQWLPEKAPELLPLFERLPRIDYRAFLPDMSLSFNSNEIAGALAWLCPLVAGLTLYRPTGTQPGETLFYRLLNLSAGIVAVIIGIALIAGQSRFAIAGVLIAFLLMIFTIIKRRAMRYGLLILWLLFTIFQANLIIHFLPGSSSPDAGLTNRDTGSVNARVLVWQKGLLMLIDHPMTGAGMSMYRTAAFVNERYQVESYIKRNTSPVHAHNEWLQIATDLGIPGLILFFVWQAGAAWMLWYGWRHGDEAHRVLVIAISGGLLAHGFYALGDAITLWDRYSFVFWLMIGMAAAQYTWLIHHPDQEQRSLP